MRPSRYMVDLTDKVFGRLTANRYAGKTISGRTMWEAVCTCGNVVLVGTNELQSGDTKSCGCLRRETVRAKNKSRSATLKGQKPAEYASWISAKRRCLDPTDKDFHRYGAAGVTFSDVWAESFSAFYEHMGDRPNGTTLDRIDNRKGYEPGNCRWSTPKTQALNRRSTRWHQLGDKTYTTEQVAKMFGVSSSAILKHVSKKGTLNGYDPRGKSKSCSQETSS